MNTLIKTLAAVAAGTVLATNAFAQSTGELREPHRTSLSITSPHQTYCGPHATCRRTGHRHRLDPIPCGERAYRTGFGAGALTVSPRIGHLHVHLDDLPWGCVEDSDNNTISVAGLPPGQHKMLVELVDANTTCLPDAVRAGRR